MSTIEHLGEDLYELTLHSAVETGKALAADADKLFWLGILTGTLETAVSIVPGGDTVDRLSRGDGSGALKGLVVDGVLWGTGYALVKIGAKVFKAVKASSTASVSRSPLSEWDRIRIQRFADKYDTDVHVMGSRAQGTALPDSDYDYILGESGGKSRLRQKARHELPRGTAGGEIHPNRGETGIDVFNELLDPTRPHITIQPYRLRG